MGRIRIPLDRAFYKKFRLLAKFRYGLGRENQNKLATELVLRFVEGEGGKVPDKEWVDLNRKIGTPDITLYKAKIKGIKAVNPFKTH